MTLTGPPAQGLGVADLTIGELATRTGLTPAVLRTWESRYGFPVPQRLASGHRRYREQDVTAVLTALRRRDAGVRLEVAVSEAARASSAPRSLSVYAGLRARHPHLSSQRLRKSTLLALTWAIEDECAADARRALLCGAFQHGRHYEWARERWEELARVAGHAWAFADFDGRAGRDGRVVRVPLAEDAPLRREWAVVCDGDGLAVALSAMELPGQGRVADRDRVFEAVWTLDPHAVRDASRVCAEVATAAGAEGAEVLAEAVRGEVTRSADPGTTTALLQRLLGHVDRLA
jgi:DNA-binding transcriptional MerR regulator